MKLTQLGPKQKLGQKATELLLEHRRERDRFFLGRAKADLTGYNTFELGLEG